MNVESCLLGSPYLDLAIGKRTQCESSLCDDAKARWR